MGFLPLCREAIGVFYSPSRLGNRFLKFNLYMSVFDNLSIKSTFTDVLFDKILLLKFEFFLFLHQTLLFMCSSSSPWEQTGVHIIWTFSFSSHFSFTFFFVSSNNGLFWLVFFCCCSFFLYLACVCMCAYESPLTHMCVWVYSYVCTHICDSVYPCIDQLIKSLFTLLLLTCV